MFLILQILIPLYYPALSRLGDTSYCDIQVMKNNDDAGSHTPAYSEVENLST